MPNGNSSIGKWKTFGTLNHTHTTLNMRGQTQHNLGIVSQSLIHNTSVVLARSAAVR